MSFYAESPLERIVDVHWKREDDGDGDGGGGPGPCGSGWFPFSGSFPGGDGFPPQRTSPPANLWLSGRILNWNPGATPPSSTPWMFQVPGLGATGVRITIVWEGVLPSTDVPPLLAAFWIFPNRNPFPRYLDANGLPPPNEPPNDPDLSADVVGSGSLEYRLSLPPPDGVGPIAIVASFAARAGLMAHQSLSIPSPFIPSVHDGDHYGWPGDPHAPEYGGIWIEVNFDCP
jgi:hypothetical protein